MRGPERVAETTLSDGKWVSTVELPVTLQSGDRFETMVFPGRGNWTDLDCLRYRTREEAEAGHAKIVAEWEAKVSP